MSANRYEHRVCPKLHEALQLAVGSSGSSPRTTNKHSPRCFRFVPERPCAALPRPSPRRAPQARRPKVPRAAASSEARLTQPPRLGRKRGCFTQRSSRRKAAERHRARIPRLSSTPGRSLGTATVRPPPPPPPLPSRHSSTDNRPSPRRSLHE